MDLKYSILDESTIKSLCNVPMNCSIQRALFFKKRESFLRSQNVIYEILDEINREMIIQIIEDLEQFDDSSMSLLSTVTQETNNCSSEIHSIGSSMPSFLTSNYCFRDTTIEKKFSESLYKEMTSDSDEDTIFNCQISSINSNWIKSLVIDYEYNSSMRGVKSTIPIPNNTIIGIYGGKIIKKKSEIKRILCGFPPHYVIETKPNSVWIDGSPIHMESNILSFINHSCHHINIRIEKITKTKVLFRTCKDIMKNEFLHFNYKNSHILLDKKQNYILCICVPGCTTRI